MRRQRPPLEVSVFQDVLCAWSYVATARLSLLAHELGDAVRFRLRPFAARVDERRPSRRDLESRLAAICRAQQEPEGRRLSPELWLGRDCPTSTVPAQLALEAARLQGETAAGALADAMRRAALEHGVNVCRRDVTFELADRVGLDLHRFSVAYDSPHTAQWLLEEQRLSLQRGVRVVPTLVIDGRWMLCGLRSVDEYRNHLLECQRRARRSRSWLPGGVVH